MNDGTYLGHSVTCALVVSMMPTPCDCGAVTKEKQRMRFGFVCKWYDFWVGAYYDRDRRRLYVLPLPCLGFWVEAPR